MHYKVSRWISGDVKETRFHESEVTSSPKRARRVSRGISEQININEL
jgi:hypothetical protein